LSGELVPTAAAGEPTSFEASLAAEREAEQMLMRSVTKSVIIGVPVGIVFFIALLAIAIGGDTEWYVILGLGSALGLVGAVLFGMLGGVTLVAHALEEVDRGGPIPVHQGGGAEPEVATPPA
jgi:hypothetical protein